MIHPDTALRFISPKIGYGVTATSLIPQGTILWVQDPLDIVISNEQSQQLNPLIMKTVEHYAFIDDQGRSILCWDSGRYVNHSCTPSSVSVGKLCNIAARDIRPGEEITEDYATLNISGTLSCNCDSPLCRATILSKDLNKVSRDLDSLARIAMLRFLHVSQPLLALLENDRLELLHAIATGECNIPSCLDNLHSQDETQLGNKTKETSKGLWARS
ncbi:MAG: SET domain-containing protein-lysine N-methyltransferase [Proteobacteria bacterium]|nr:SET domain-containing protein-lysine N-methyltransferase [Pseudomonadota bacterium]